MADAAPGKHWVYTAAGVERSKQSRYPVDERYPGQSVPDHYKQSCPDLWADNGWVEQAEVIGEQLELF